MTRILPFRRQRYDAVVVGGRVAGAATAMLLARAGQSVLMLDREPAGADTMSTHALMRGAVLQLSRWGLLPAIEAAATPLIDATVFRYGDEEIVVDIKPDADVPGLYAPRRRVLDAILVDAAWTAGAEIRHDSTVLGLVRGASGRVVGVTVRGPDGTVRTVEAGIVVGADGLGSTVARQVEAAVLREGEAVVSCLYAYVRDPGLKGYRWMYGPRESLGLIPTNDGLACLFVAVPVARYDAELREDVRAGYRRLLADLDPGLAAHVARVGLAEPIRAFRGRPGVLRQAHGEGWVLVGDAGFFRDPLTAHGITDALRDAEGAANAILRGGRAGFEAFQQERDALAGPLLETTDAVAAFDWTLDELKGRHKAFSTAMKAEMAVLAARRAGDPDRFFQLATRSA